MMNKIFLYVLPLIICVLPLRAQLAFDTLLFTIPLINDASKQDLFNVHNVKKIKDALSGPVVMKNDNLLFYSKYGYVLYNQKGRILDSHSVFKMNKGMSETNPKRMICAFPINSTSVLYYKEKSNGKESITLYEKKLFKRGRIPMSTTGYKFYKETKNKHVYNLAFNSITDDMKECFCPTPRLIGFTSMENGDTWWSVDKFYSSASPIINIRDEKFKSIFPGMKFDEDFRRVKTLKPLQIYSRDDHWFYSAVTVRGGLRKEEDFQTYFVFDQAGNVLYTDTLLQSENMDVIIGEDEDTYYTVKKVKRNVFLPSVSKNGDVYYGTINYEKRRIDVRKRVYYVYKAVPCKTPAELSDLFTNEKCIEYVPVELECSTKPGNNFSIPKITLIDSKTKKYIQAKESHLKKDSYVCYISRSQNDDIRKKLLRGRDGVPRKLRGTIDKLAKDPLITCPNSIILKAPWMVVRSFSYPPGVKVLCARILASLKNGEIIIRVDCKDYAEILIFESDGSFVNRFIFNNQYYEERLDIIVASTDNRIVELDYESKPESHTFQKWVRSLTDR